ncbi:MAG: HipA domain-containing protein [Gemmatimonadota bacterium]|nr:HipA domain-containing protein [Gemmatimonadota bacterium]
MPEKYAVVEVKGEWERDSEDMGSKRKFWYSNPTAGKWLFKFPRGGSGEHWAEKIAAEVAGILGIDHAIVELAIFEGRRGSTTKSFANVDAGQILIHGNQLLELEVQGYDSSKKFKQSSHTLEHIWQVLDSVLHESEDAKYRFADYLVFDAIIGNTDRHHENWGLLFQMAENEVSVDLAPTYDHASSLGRELSDTKRERLFANNQIGTYVERARGAIYWSESDSRSISPLELVRRSVDAYPDWFGPALQRIKKLNKESILNQSKRIPDDWISALGRNFMTDQLDYNISMLQELSA